MSGHRDYLTYVHFCCAVGVVPWTPQQWSMMTQQSVDIHWEKWAEYISKVKRLAVKQDVPDDREGAWARHIRPHRPDDTLRADCYKAGLFVGELRPDGSVNIVRHQPGARSGGEHKLLFRVCRVCGEFLPITRYSKQGKSIRAVCKVCDSKRRVLARKSNKQK